MTCPSDLIILGMARANLPHPWERSLTAADAATIVEQFASLLTNTGASFDAALADQLLADGFSSHSDSAVQATANVGPLLCPPSPPPVNHPQLGAVSVPSKHAFIGHQSSVAPSIAPSIETISIHHSCREIMWRFQINPTLPSVRGMTIFLISASKQIDAVFIELRREAGPSNDEAPDSAARCTVTGQEAERMRVKGMRQGCS